MRRMRPVWDSRSEMMSWTGLSTLGGRSTCSDVAGVKKESHEFRLLQAPERDPSHLSPRAKSRGLKRTPEAFARGAERQLPRNPRRRPEPSRADGSDQSTGRRRAIMRHPPPPLGRTPPILTFPRGGRDFGTGPEA